MSPKMVPDRRVLIVEDEAVIALDVEAELKAHGWQVVGVVHSSERALDVLKTEKIDAAVLDINLKNDTSYTFADICSTMDIAVVFLSGDDGRSRPAKPDGRAAGHETARLRGTTRRTGERRAARYLTAYPALYNLRIAAYGRAHDRGPRFMTADIPGFAF